MSKPIDPATTEPNPFEKFMNFARRIIAVPKAEADAKDREWREEREKTTGKKRLPRPR